MKGAIWINLIWQADSRVITWTWTCMRPLVLWADSVLVLSILDWDSAALRWSDASSSAQEHSDWLKCLVYHFLFDKQRNFICVKLNKFLCKQEAQSPSQEAALLLHRKGFDCSSTPEPLPQCTWSVHEEVNTTHTHFYIIIYAFCFQKFRFPFCFLSDFSNDLFSSSLILFDYQP